MHANPPAVWDTELLSKAWHPSPARDEWATWFGRHWADPLPVSRSGLFMRPFRSVHADTIDGFACCVVVEESQHVSQWKRAARGTNQLPAPPNTTGIIVGWRPNAPPGPTGGVWGKLGHILTLRGQLDPSSVFAQLREAARVAGAEPLYAVAEISDPTPLRAEARAPVAPDPEADRRLESEAVRCSGCGAPSFVAELIGAGRCGFCGATQALPPDLGHALAAYRRRIRAALIAAPSRGSAAWAARPAPPGHVTLACAHCGAPNAHRPGVEGELCQSCQAPLVPSSHAMARGLAVQQEVAVAAHTHAVLVEQARYAGQFERASAMTDDLGAMIAFTILGTFVLYVVLGIAGLVTGNSKLFIPLTAVTPMALIVVVVAWFWRRMRQAAVARSAPRYAALAEQLHAQRLSLGTLHEWAARWWQGRLPTHTLRTGVTWCALAWRLAGFPMALSSHVEVIHGLISAPGMTPPAHITVLLGGRPPRDVRYWMEQPAAKAASAQLKALGFELSVDAGGLSARSRQPLVNAARAEPDRMMVVSPVAYALCRLAFALDIEPGGVERG